MIDGFIRKELGCRYEVRQRLMGSMAFTNREKWTCHLWLLTSDCERWAHLLSKSPILLANKYTFSKTNFKQSPHSTVIHLVLSHSHCSTSNTSDSRGDLSPRLCTYSHQVHVESPSFLFPLWGLEQALQLPPLSIICKTGRNKLSQKSCKLSMSNPKTEEPESGRCQTGGQSAWGTYFLKKQPNNNKNDFLSLRPS